MADSDPTARKLRDSSSPTLGPGVQVGPYEILGPLGAGGMGEVYRAHDTRLGRDVALKVLPAVFAADPERLRRFEQEARAAGRLNHPNLLAVHDFGSTHEGAPYVVTELLEGETLRARMGGSALPARKAIDYALQIASGLAAAHDKGIVHRDLKPENLFVTRDGRVKILDFGLAKLLGPEPVVSEPSLPSNGATPSGGSDSASSPRASGSATPAAGMPSDASPWAAANDIERAEAPTVLVHTQPGAILGTAGYMSPEQVRGRPVDQRSDLFSFGAILYEMLSGRRAFGGDSAVETMNAILKDEPADLSATTRALPPALERIVRHALEKSPEERYQTARDLAFHLQALSDPSGPVALVPAFGAGRSKRRAWLVAMAGTVILASALATVFIAGKRAGKAPLPEFQQLTFRRGSLASARFAPDGQTILYSAQWDGRPSELFTTRPESPESRPIEQCGAALLAVSSTGEMALSLGAHAVRPFTMNGTLARAPISGGAPREVVEEVQWADWGPDGTELAIVRDMKGMNQLEYPIGKLLYQSPGGWVSHARVSADGKRVAFVDHPIRGDDGGNILVVDRAGQKRVLSKGWMSAQGLAWSPRGDEVWFTATRAGLARAVWAVTLDGEERVLARVTGTLTLQDVSRDGRTLLTHDNARMRIAFKGAGDATERDLSWLDWSLARDLSRDGKMLLFDETGQGAGSAYGVYLRGTDGSPAVRLGDGVAMALSPDGRWVVSFSRQGHEGIVLLPARAGERRVLGNALAGLHWAAWLPDSKRLLVAGNLEGHSPNLFVMDIETKTPRAIAEEGSGGPAAISPDGKLVAARDHESTLAIFPVDGGGAPRRIPGVKRGDLPMQWSEDGRKLYLFRWNVRPAQILRLDLATNQVEVWKEVAPSDPAGLMNVSLMRLTPDGQSYAYSYARFLSDLYLVRGIR